MELRLGNLAGIRPCVKLKWSSVLEVQKFMLEAAALP